MKHKKTLLFTVAAVTILSGSLLTSTQAFAQSPMNDQHRMSSLVQKIADKFGLKKEEVQAVFDQAKEEHRSQTEAHFDTRLSQLVTEGKITEAQKQLIVAKRQELEANRQSQMDSIKTKTAAERKAAMDAERQKLEEWAKQNGIDLKYLLFGGRGKGPGMHKMRMGPQ
jgi:hypothetical protein